MNVLTDALAYLLSHLAEFQTAVRAHLLLSGLALAVALALCVPLGVLTSRWAGGGRLVVNAVGVARVVPSIAVLFLLLPYLHLGFRPAPHPALRRP